jgi:L-ribulose-5-phosphate 3-epimerase
LRVDGRKDDGAHSAPYAMLLGYNTNGLAHHSLESGLRLLAGIGYGSVAITLDHAHLNPFAEDFREQLGRTRDLLAELRMRSGIETGARYLLDPERKHYPTLLSRPEERARRIEFYRRAINAAAELGSDCVSLWSGVPLDFKSEEEALDYLGEGLREVLDYAARRNVTVAFEPEPGMLVDTMARFEELLERIDAPHLKLTLDIGHLHCQGEVPIADYIRRWGPRIANVHIEDMRRRVHEHLMFGEGEIDFPPVIAALREVGYRGGLHVELSGHSRLAPVAARWAYEFLDYALKYGATPPPRIEYSP